jgi:hypothetical protein
MPLAEIGPGTNALDTVVDEFAVRLKKLGLAGAAK